jgi:hypothetical protein
MTPLFSLVFLPKCALLPTHPPNPPPPAIGVQPCREVLSAMLGSLDYRLLAACLFIGAFVLSIPVLATDLFPRLASFVPAHRVPSLVTVVVLYMLAAVAFRIVQSQVRASDSSPLYDQGVASPFRCRSWQHALLNLACGQAYIWGTDKLKDSRLRFFTGLKSATEGLRMVCS